MQENRTKQRRPASRRGTEPTRPQNTKRHKRKRRGNNILLYCMVLGLMATIGTILIFTVFFKVKTVQAVGVTRYSAQSVVESSSIPLEINMFRLNREGIERNLMRQYSYFEKVRIRFRLPDTIIIQVTEAVPVAAIQQGGSYLLFSKSFRVLETGAPTLPQGLPVIKGFSAMTLKAGDQVDTTGKEQIGLLESRVSERKKEYARNLDKNKKAEADATKVELDGLQQQLTLLTQEWTQRNEQLRALTAFLRCSAEAELKKIQFIDLSDQYNLLAGYDGRVLLLFGSESELAYKMQAAKNILEVECEPDYTGILDLTIPGKVFARPITRSISMSDDEFTQYLYSQVRDVTHSNANSEASVPPPSEGENPSSSDASSEPENSTDAAPPQQSASSSEQGDAEETPSQ